MFDWFKRQRRQRPSEYHHPTLGVIVRAGGVWGGVTVQGRRDIAYWLAGDAIAPNSALLDRLCQLLERFEAVQRIATTFLREQEPDVRDAHIDCYAIELIRPEMPAEFTLEFLADRDDTRVWRVDFVNGEPARTGFDD